MSLRDILGKVKGLNSRLSDLTADVEDLKKKDQDHQKMKKVDNRSRSRSPRSRSRERASQHSGEWCSQTMRKESYSSEEEDNIEALAEVSEETHRLLTDSCVRGVSSETRKRTRSHFKFPKVDATRSPKLDAVLKNVTSQSAQSADNERGTSGVWSRRRWDDFSQQRWLDHFEQVYWIYYIHWYSKYSFTNDRKNTVIEELLKIIIQ